MVNRHSNPQENKDILEKALIVPPGGQKQEKAQRFIVRILMAKLTHKLLKG